MKREKEKIKYKNYENVRRALFQLPRQHAGQMKELAEYAGINYDRLRRATSDVETTREGRDISLVEALRVMEAAEDYSVLFAVCAELGFETPRRWQEEIPRKVGCDELMKETLAISSSIGELSAVIKSAVADSRISEVERRQILDAIEKSQHELEKIRHLVIKAT
ncbi:MAG: hypothetical protein HY819_22905 [Acidobacteria bacterium]|nr:hypothetical protein [Acidobacteriota bacterium]